MGGHRFFWRTSPRSDRRREPVDPSSTRSAQFPAGLPRGAGLAILRAVGRGRRTVSEIVELTGLSQPNVSNHLARFRERKWVQAERSGRKIEYSISDSALADYVEQITRAGGAPSEAEK